MSDDDMPSLADLMDGDDEEVSDVDYVAARVAESTHAGFHSGFVCFVGRPNAGKSTLTNALVGSKIAIASSKPQTTRHVIRGVVTDEKSQIVVIDTPGLHKPRTLLGQRLNDLVFDTWTQVDVIGVCLPSNQRIGPGDTYLVSHIADLPRRPTLVALATKSDLVPKARMAEHLVAIDRLQQQVGVEFTEIIPCSAVSGEQVDEVRDVIVSLLPEGPAYYPDGEVTDEPTETLVAELIREAALEGVREELPHSLAVEIVEMGLREGQPDDQQLLDVYASLIVERESQKGIMIGHHGSHIKQVRTHARRQIAALLGTPTHLDLQVKVLPNWQSDVKYLNRLGF
ncbi:GTPase Era [Cutibacterium sp. WCA-380-WT-3A]|uniref:GTPase Era n=1 Tax=Cutibacterium porci TaxID=2605781 RepID=A0A7K0J793_9ACTN|nr:GTPase Era [Cutibacterium porci]MSS45713.1 GTPase Era [Cutibacterium porci]